MTAEQYYNENFSRPEIDWYGEKEITLTLMKEFALLKCAEQREICADEVQTLNSGQRIKIQDSPSPKM